MVASVSSEGPNSSDGLKQPPVSVIFVNETDILGFVSTYKVCGNTVLIELICPSRGRERADSSDELRFRIF